MNRPTILLGSAYFLLNYFDVQRYGRPLGSRFIAFAQRIKVQQGHERNEVMSCQEKHEVYLQ